MDIPNYKLNYNVWLEHIEELDIDLKSDFEKLSLEEIKENFSTELGFGTAGIRGIMGPGTSRMNIYTIRRASIAFAKFLHQTFDKNILLTKGIIIGHDNRHNSVKFTNEAAHVLTSYQIKVQLFPFNEITPTPLVSFAVQNTDAIGGIVITASHNPKQYNGYKIYDKFGGQYLPEETNIIEDFYVKALHEAMSIKLKCKYNLISDLSNDIKDQYYDFLKNIPFNKTKTQRKTKVVFSNLNGAGRNWAPVVLQELGYEVHCVKEQHNYDPDFTTCPSPNPEITSNYDLAINLAHKHDADIIILNDPDADRMGLAIKNDQNKYQILTGNEAGPLLLQYWLSMKQKHGQMPFNPVMYNTFVTTHLGDLICDKYNVKNIKTLTGFKWLTSRIELIKQYDFVFCYEEACGYLLNSMVRDKDGIQTSIVIVDACEYYLQNNKTLFNVLQDIYTEFGYHYCYTYKHTYEGIEGFKNIQKILHNLRSKGKKQISNIDYVEDYLDGLYDMPPQNLLKFYFKDKSWLAVRASGTEPIIKFYYDQTGVNLEDAIKKQTAKQKELNDLFII